MDGVSIERYRGWFLFQVEDPQQAASDLSGLLTEGGSTWVIVRTDVVAGNYDLVIPVDAENEAGFQEAQEKLTAQLGKPASVLCVLEHIPWPPHSSHTVITPGELDGFYLPEYDPPGRHPNSPGANPWG